jgi:SAM-dependent methyltransferase
MPTTATPYDSRFFAALSEKSARSAHACVPVIMDLLSPGSVIDVGCGQGDWLRAFQQCGVSDFLGVDGDYVERDELRIPENAFLSWDLNRPLALDRRFDLAVSLEVAEHLPARAAASFIRSLTALAPAVAFSAAVPGQGGVNHLNEQWPWYWKKLFARCQYVCLDPFRKQIWSNPDVAFWYQQNLFLYVDPAVHRALIERVGVPDRDHELTLVQTTLLQALTRARGGPVRRFARRVWSRLNRSPAEPQG